MVLQYVVLSLSLLLLVVSLVVVARLYSYTHGVLKRGVDELLEEEGRWEDLTQEVVTRYLPEEGASVAVEFLRGDIELEDLKRRLPSSGAETGRQTVLRVVGGRGEE